MSKVNSKQETLLDEEMAQFEHSAEIATEFINDEILTLLDDFEHNNEDDRYIYGVATLGLFTEVVKRLGAMGYTEKELRKELKDYINSSYGEILH